MVSEYLKEHDVVHVKYVSRCVNAHSRVNVIQRYQGDMKRAERDKAVRVFMSEMKSQVLLLSLKCGGNDILIASFGQSFDAPYQVLD